MVDVEQRALRALEQNALAGAALAVEQVPGHVDERQDLGRDLGKLAHQRLFGDLRLAEPAAQRVVVHEDAIDLRPERRQVAQILHADGAAPDLVLVGGPDAAAGGADLAGAGRLLAQRRRARGAAAG